MYKNNRTANNSLKPSLSGKMLFTTVYCKKEIFRLILLLLIFCSTFYSVKMWFCVTKASCTSYDFVVHTRSVFTCWNICFVRTYSLSYVLFAKISVISRWAFRILSRLLFLFLKLQQTWRGYGNDRRKLMKITKFSHRCTYYTMSSWMSESFRCILLRSSCMSWISVSISVITSRRKSDVLRIG